MELLQVFDHHGAGSFAVEGKDHGLVAAQRNAQLPGGLQGQKAAIQQLPVKAAHYGSIGGDHYRVFGEAHLGDQWHRIGLPAPGSDDDFNASGFGRL